MDTKRSIYNISIHKHPLFFSARFFIAECYGCHVTEYIYGGYICNEPYCSVTFHKECANAPPQINHHPSHSEHPLLLTNGSQHRGSPCDCCGKKLRSPFYTCSTCKFKVDLVCGMKPSPHTIERPRWHDHSVVFLKTQEVDVSCDACKESINGASYSCLECHVYFHLDCIHLSKEVIHRWHSSHPIKVFASESLPDNCDIMKHCCFCLVPRPKVFYHCYMCNFTMCFACTKHPPPLAVEDIKTHTHPLWLFSNRIAFTCKFCGLEGYGNIPYICFTCNFVVHGYCIALPHVININRHDHRIYFTDHHGKRTKCGVCRKTISQYGGAYVCSVCPNYTVHSRCAFDYNLWNGVELEGIPERNEDIEPFKVVGHNLIRHFSHIKHTLRLLKNILIHDDECRRCEACISPVRFGPIYACVECPFVFHEKCAKLPKKKRLVFDPALYTLKCDSSALIYCKLCEMLCHGFKYISQGGIIQPYSHVDVHCGSISEPFVHVRHLHPLYFVKTKKDHHCDICTKIRAKYMLKCDTCYFYLCLYCATLPEEICHMSDEHPLTLYYGGKGKGTSWCEVCEMELLFPSRWFFTCSECGVALHVQCALGDFSRLRPEWLCTFGRRDYKVVLNSHNSRPFCSHCHFRCKAPLILKEKGKDNGYICSLACLSSCLGIEFVYFNEIQ